MRLIYKIYFSEIITSFLITKYQKTTLFHILNITKLKITLAFPTLKMKRPFLKYFFHYLSLFGVLPPKIWFLKKMRVEKLFLQYSFLMNRVNAFLLWNFLMKFSFFGLANVISNGLLMGQGSSVTNFFFSRTFMYPETKFFNLTYYFFFKTAVSYSFLLSRTWKKVYFHEQRNLLRLFNIPYLAQT